MIMPVLPGLLPLASRLFPELSRQEFQHWKHLCSPHDIPCAARKQAREAPAGPAPTINRSVLTNSPSAIVMPPVGLVLGIISFD